MAKTINMLDSDIIISMKGDVDLNHYCPKCEANEFHGFGLGLGISCAHCGHEIDDNFLKHTTFWDCSDDEKSYLLSKTDFVNKNITRVGLSAFNYEMQMEVNERFDKQVLFSQTS